MRQLFAKSALWNNNVWLRVVTSPERADKDWNLEVKLTWDRVFKRDWNERRLSTWNEQFCQTSEPF